MIARPLLALLSLSLLPLDEVLGRLDLSLASTATATRKAEKLCSRAVGDGALDGREPLCGHPTQCLLRPLRRLGRRSGGR